MRLKFGFGTGSLLTCCVSASLLLAQSPNGSEDLALENIGAETAQPSQPISPGSSPMATAAPPSFSDALNGDAPAETVVESTVATRKWFGMDVTDPDPNSDRYFQAGFLIWQFTDPRENGTIFRSTTNSLGGGGGTFVQEFRTGQARTDVEGGLRLTYGAKINDLTAVEISGHWLHPSRYPLGFNAGVFTSNGVTTTTTAQIVPTNEGITSALLLYQIQNHGVELNSRTLLLNNGMLKLEGLLGLRYIEHDELYSHFIITTADVPISESFVTENTFFGPQLGVNSELRILDAVTLKNQLKTMIAANMHDIKIAGTSPGRFISPLNLGERAYTSTTSVFDLSSGIAVDLTPNIQFYVGLDFIWFGDVARAMDQLDFLNVNNNARLRPSHDIMWLWGMSSHLQISF